MTEAASVRIARDWIRLSPGVRPVAGDPLVFAPDVRVAAVGKAVLEPSEGPKQGPRKKEDPSVLKYQIWPGSEAPALTTAQDARLAKAGMLAQALNWLDSKIALPIADWGRFLTRTVGPGMFWVSGVANAMMLVKDWNKKSLSPGVKSALLAGTAATAAAATSATWAALPIQGALLANRFSGLFGGLAGGIFSGLNMIVTLGNKQATTVQKIAATGGFATGMMGTLFCTAAAFLPAGASLGPLGLGAWGLIFGVSSMALGIGQWLLGKNKWLNDKVSAIGRWFKGDRNA